MRDLIFEHKRYFNEFRQSEEKIASNILKDRLNMLEREGMISARPDPGHKQKIIYSLTQKSIDLLPLLIESIRWSLKYEPVDHDKYKPAVELVEGGQQAQQQLLEKLKLTHLIQNRPV